MKILRGAVVVVVKDEKGSILAGTTRRVACFSPLEVEVLGIKEAIQFENSLGISKDL